MPGEIADSCVITGTTDDAPIASSVGLFEITGFRGLKFENHEEDAIRVDSLSECPAVEKACR